MAQTTTKAFDFDEAYRMYKAEEDQRLNGHFPWTLARRVAFSRWRRALLHLSQGPRDGPGKQRRDGR